MEPEAEVIKILERKEIFEENILQVRIHSTVEADTREAYRIDREIAEPFKVWNGLSDLERRDREDLLLITHDEERPFLTDDLHSCPSQETSCFHLRKCVASIQQAEHEAQFFVWQFLPRLRYI